MHSISQLDQKLLFTATNATSPCALYTSTTLDRQSSIAFLWDELLKSIHSETEGRQQRVMFRGAKTGLL